MEPSPVFETVPVRAGDPAAQAGKRIRLENGKTATLCQFAPGKFEAVVETRDVPRFGICKMMRQQDGRYIPVVTHYSALVQVTPKTPEELGLRGMHWRALRRLVDSGLVRGMRPTPHVCLVDLASLVEHLEATRDREFWTEERKEEFRTVY